MKERQFTQKQRYKVKRERKKIIAICCEGKNQTEKLYFNNFKTRDIIIKFSKGNETDPEGMVNNLINFLTSEGIDTNDGDKAFLILDGDIDNSKQLQLNNAIEKAKANNIEVILSVPCFELWYLLHFIYTSRPYASNQQLLKDLKKHLPDYSKNANVFTQIKGYTDVAIANSKKLEQFHIDNGQVLNNVSCNPYTGVHKIVEYIKNIT